MSLSDGNYETEHGSTVKLSKNGGVTLCEFDWFEEPNACDECVVNPYPEEEFLVWRCDKCEGGSAKLTKVEEV